MKPACRKYMFWMVILVWIAVITTNANAQSEPLVGEPCPAFTLHQVINFKKETASSSDFKGKWTFIDFWSTTCTSCIASFKKIDAIQRAYPDGVQFMLVGKLDNKHNRTIREVFAKVSKVQQLVIPSAFDSTLFKDWNVGALPTIFVIDPSGVVRYITDGRDLSVEKVGSLLRKENVQFYPAWTQTPVVAGPLTDSVLYRSQLKRWTAGRQAIYDKIDRWMLNPPEIRQQGWHVRKAPLFMMYDLAYFGACSWQRDDSTFYGKYWRFPILELTDTADFRFDFTNVVAQGTFDYELILEQGQYSKEKIMQLMQVSLRDAFGYTVNIEERPMPVWTLKEISKGSADRIATKGGEPFNSWGDIQTGYNSPAAGFTLRNQPVDVLLHLLTAGLTDGYRRVYASGLPATGNVDFSIEADMLDLASVRTALRKRGLDLVPLTRAMKVLVISRPDYLK